MQKDAEGAKNATDKEAAERDAKKKIAEESLFNATKAHAIAASDADRLKTQEAINAAQKELDSLQKEKEEADKLTASI